MATEAQIRLILQNVLGDFGNQLTAAGEIRQEGGHNAPPNPNLMDRLTTMRRKAETTKPPGPDTFRGTTTENARIWKTKMQDYLDHCGYPAANNEERLRVIKMFLSDQALIWYQNLPNHDKDTVAHFWEAFNGNYFGQGTQYALEQTLLSRRQQSGEKVEDYIGDVISKANQLDWQANRTIAHLIAGLNAKLKPFVMMKNPETLAETVRAIEMAAEAVKSQGADLETIQSALKELVVQVKADKDDKKVSAVTVPVPPEQPTVVNYMTPEFHPRQDNSFKRRPFNKPPMRPIFPINVYTGNTTGFGSRRRPQRFAGGPTFHGPAFNRPKNPNTPFGSGSPPTCWVCGSISHFRMDCPFFNRKNQNARGRRGRGNSFGRQHMRGQLN